MKQQPPIWSIPLLFVILSLAFLVGEIPLLPGVVVVSETIAYSVYILLLSRRGIRRGTAVANLLSLYPGHLLLLFAISLVPNPTWLISLWAMIPVASIGYDAVGRRAPGGRWRTSTSIGLYCIIWADLFYLLERVIAIKRGFERSEEVIAAVAFGAVGILFISLGVYRHLRAGKEG